MAIIKFFIFTFCFLWSVEIIPMLSYYQLMIKKITECSKFFLNIIWPKNGGGKV